MHPRTDNERPKKRMNMNTAGFKPINQPHSIVKAHEALGGAATPQGDSKQREQLIPADLFGGNAESSAPKNLLEDSGGSRQENLSLGVVQQVNGSSSHLTSRQHTEEVSSLQSLVRSLLNLLISESGSRHVFQQRRNRVLTQYHLALPLKNQEIPRANS